MDIKLKLFFVRRRVIGKLDVREREREQAKQMYTTIYTNSLSIG